MILHKLRELVRGLYEAKNVNRSDWADWMYQNHIFVVADYARELSDTLRAQKDIAVAAALLHDIADAVMKREDKNHGRKSLEIAKRFLQEAEFSKKEIEIITKDILPRHGCHNGECPKSLEGKIMATADALAHLKTDFYKFAKQEFLKSGVGLDKYYKWMLPKVKRDFEQKICFDKLRTEVGEKYRDLVREAIEYMDK